MTTKEIIRYLRTNYPQLIAFQKKKRLKKLFKILIVEAVLAVVYLLCRSAFNDLGFGDALIVSIAVLGVLAPIWIKPRFVFLASAKHGKIVKLNVVTVGGAKDVKLMNWVESRQSHTVLTLIARSESGASFELVLPDHYAQAMRVGDEILKLPAVDNPIIVSRGHSKHLCPICGNIAPISEDECIGCGNKFVRFD